MVMVMPRIHSGPSLVCGLIFPGTSPFLHVSRGQPWMILVLSGWTWTYICCWLWGATNKDLNSTAEGGRWCYYMWVWGPAVSDRHVLLVIIGWRHFVGCVICTDQQRSQVIVSDVKQRPAATITYGFISLGWVGELFKAQNPQCQLTPLCSSSFTATRHEHISYLYSGIQLLCYPNQLYSTSTWSWQPYSWPSSSGSWRQRIWILQGTRMLPGSAKIIATYVSIEDSCVELKIKMLMRMGTLERVFFWLRVRPISRKVHPCKSSRNNLPWYRRY